MQSLHRKYGVSVAAISGRAKKENWSGLSKQVQEKTEQKIIEKLSDDLTDVESTYINAVKLALTTVYCGLSSIAAEDPKSLRAYVSALKDIKDMGVIKIAEDNNNVEISLEEALEEYAQ